MYGFEKGHINDNIDDSNHLNINEFDSDSCSESDSLLPSTSSECIVKKIPSYSSLIKNGINIDSDHGDSKSNKTHESFNHSKYKNSLSKRNDSFSSHIGSAVSFISNIFMPSDTRLFQSMKSPPYQNITLSKANPKIIRSKSDASFGVNNNKVSNGIRSIDKNYTTRPIYLPPKSPEEEESHRKKYEEMMRHFMIKEEKEKQLQIKRQAVKKNEIYMMRGAWKEIFPVWERHKNTAKVRELIRQGIPPDVRMQIWPLLIGDNLNISKELFSFLVSKKSIELNINEDQDVKDKKSDSFNLIPVDLSRTFPALGFFRNDGPNHMDLRVVLEAYVMYRPDQGYVQGMSYLAAVLLLYLDQYLAFKCLANLLNRDIQLNFYRLDHSIQPYLNIFDELFEIYLPKLHDYFKNIGLTNEVFLIDWILTLFSRSLPIDAATRIWDIYLLEGDSIIFLTSIAILKIRQSTILSERLGLECCSKCLGQAQDIEDEILLKTLKSIDPKQSESTFSKVKISLYKV